MMDKEELKRLGDFIEENFDFDALKKSGMFPKGTRRKDYEKIAQRLCTFFGFETIFEYKRLSHDERTSPTTIDGKFADEVDKHGNIIEGGGYHLDIVETEFTCPICTCEQDATESRAYNNAKYPVVTIKCKGCKRKLILSNDMGGNLTVKEA